MKLIKKMIEVERKDVYILVEIGIFKILENFLDLDIHADLLHLTLEIIYIIM